MTIDMSAAFFDLSFYGSCGVETGDNCGWSRRRDNSAAQVSGFEFREAGLAHGRHLGHDLGALTPGHHNGADFAGLAAALKCHSLNAIRQYTRTTPMRPIPKSILTFALVLSLCTTGHSQTPEENAKSVETRESWNIHGQATAVSAYKNNFKSPYFGAKSLLNKTDGDITKSYTLTGTAYLGARLWEGAEFYYNPEAFQGLPFSDLSGLGGFNNGELQKGSSVPMIFYNARSFVKQTIGLGGGQEYLQSAPNQLAGNVDKRRITLTYGTFSALDFFDNNSYSQNPRTQFLNWSLMASGAYDYAASSRGYSYGVVGEYFDADWVLRMARLAVPQTPNVLNLDYQLTQQYGDQLELAHSHTLAGQPGKTRVLLFQNRGVMATYKDAITLGQQTNTTPNLFNARYGYQKKWGYTLNLEQAVTENTGVFARWSWNDGKTETQSFTDINQSLSGGASIQGTSWGRPADTIGLGFAINVLSPSAVSYLSLGGITMFIGDGRINYRKEQIFEAFYSLNVYKNTYISADYQRIANPGYNADRGPVNFIGVRGHFEF